MQYYLDLKEKIKDKKMSKISKLKRSRDNWKSKALDRSKVLQYNKKQRLRIATERDKYKAKARELQRELEKERKKKLPPVCHKIDMIYLSLNLFLIGSIGFRAISRVFGILKMYLGITKAPSPQTIINWVTRYSLSKVWHYPSSSHASNLEHSNDSIWMIDVSICLGAGKILAVLEFQVNHHEINEGAPTLQTVNCLSVI